MRPVLLAPSLRPALVALGLRPALVALGLSACMTHAVPPSRAIEAISPAAPVRVALPDPVRVVTFNVHGVPGHVIANAIAADPWLRDADVIVLEEVHGRGSCSAACVAARELGFHAVFEPENVDRDGTDGVAILARAPLTAARVIELPYFNVVINSGRAAALAASVRIGDRDATIYAVHLTNRLTVRQRRAQIMPVLEDARRQTTPVIIAGDFNTSPFTWLGHLVPVPTGTQDDRFEELLRASGFATPVAASGPTSRFLSMKLDGIYTRGFDTFEYATAEADDISDHLALWAWMRLASAN